MAEGPPEFFGGWRDWVKMSTEVDRPYRLDGKVALVTGGASGIGAATCRELTRAGARVLVADLNLVAAQALAAELEGARAVEMDVTSAASVEAARAGIPKLDILVNNAGIQFVAPVEEFPEAKWDAIIAINLSAVFYGMKFAIPGMKAKQWGRIINIASAHGLVASPHKVAYVAAKHGVVGATKVAAIELANDGITVNAICPGWVLTPLVEHQLEDRAKEAGTDVPTEEKKMLQETQPMLKFTTPEEIGALAVFLCSEGAKTITGVPLPIDGGWVAH